MKTYTTVYNDVTFEVTLNNQLEIESIVEIDYPGDNCEPSESEESDLHNQVLEQNDLIEEYDRIQSEQKEVMRGEAMYDESKGK